MSAADSVKPKVIGDWWYCGDEVCCCSHPQVRAIRPTGGGVGEPRGLYEEGPWASDGETTREQWEWLLAAARRHNVDNLGDIETEAKAFLDLT